MRDALCNRDKEQHAARQHEDMPDRVVKGQALQKEEHHTDGIYAAADQHQHEHRSGKAGQHLPASVKRRPTHRQIKCQCEPSQPRRGHHFHRQAKGRRSPQPDKQPGRLTRGKQRERRVGAGDFHIDGRMIQPPEQARPSWAVHHVAQRREAEHQDQRSAIDRYADDCRPSCAG